jgi:hypothetical protein
LHVSKDDNFEYDDSFWTSEEPLNMLQIQDHPLKKSYKTQFFYELPLSELLILTDKGLKTKLRLPSKRTLSSLFIDNKMMEL